MAQSFSAVAAYFRSLSERLETGVGESCLHHIILERWRRDDGVSPTPTPPCCLHPRGNTSGDTLHAAPRAILAGKSIARLGAVWL